MPNTPLQTIAILRHGSHRDHIDADVDGAFAIHETIPVQLGGWTVTHVPTGWACLTTQHRVAALAARAELLASGLDWNFTDPTAVTSAHRIVGKRVKEKYAGR